MRFTAARFARFATILLAALMLGGTAFGTERGLVDTVGIASTAVQMDSVLAQCARLAAAGSAQADESYGSPAPSPLIAAICPHDDYYYAGRLYELTLPRIRAKRVIVFGVFHKAAAFGARDQLVFDAFTTWRGPYGPVRVSPLREEILRLLPPEDFVVSDTMQSVEHSVEAMVPFLQAGNPEVEILSILVPPMDGDTMNRLAGDLARALETIVRNRSWRLGADIAFVVSNDAVHYGDSGWGGRNYADLGTGLPGYQAAVGRDMQMAESLLCGPVSWERLEAFLYTCVEKADVTRYRVTWCGRFSVPLGLDVISQVTQKIESRPLTGFLLDYGTSVSEASLDVTALGGLGPTAPNNFHHFVGYAAIGYR